MKLISSVFNDFEMYSEAVKGWALDFRLLSRNDFYASLVMASFPNIVISRTKLVGKIEQLGLTPEGYRTIAIPVEKKENLVWLNKIVEENMILVFPEDRSLDAVSHNEFDVYVVSIKEDFLYETIDYLECAHCLELFDGNEKYVVVVNAFLHLFSFRAERLLSAVELGDKQHDFMLNQLISMLLLNMNGEPEIESFVNPIKRDLALKKAVEIINNEQDRLFSIPELCQIVEVSERTLQYAFQNKFQVSPHEYMKAIRLHKVKRKLHAMSGENISISSLAGEFHFWHMGEFANDFRRQFGVLPSDILRAK